MVDLLILTSCINPDRQSKLKLSDCSQRLEQTIDSLKFFIDSKCICRIVLCDGSDYDLNAHWIKDYALANQIEIEFLHFLQNSEKVRKKGKGFGEGEIMQYILNNSTLYSKSFNFAKVTGRLKIDNISNIVSRVKHGVNYFNIIAAKGLGCIDTRFYIVDTNIYNAYFRESYLNVNDFSGHSYEYCFRDTIKQNKIKIKPFPIVPIIKGISGTMNKEYYKDSYYYACVIFTYLRIMNTKMAALCLLIIKIIKDKLLFK